MKLLCLIILLTVAFTVHAQTIATPQPRITFTPPSEFTDGSPLDPLTDLTGYLFECTNPGFEPINIPNDVSDYVADTFAPGSYTCTMKSLGVNGIDSLPSAPVSFDVPPQPGTPTTIIITIVIQ